MFLLRCPWSFGLTAALRADSFHVHRPRNGSLVCAKPNNLLIKVPADRQVIKASDKANERMAVIGVATQVALKPARRPTLLQMVRGTAFSTVAVIAGDMTCQWLEDPNTWDKARTQRMATATACVLSPCSWVIMLTLERLFPGVSTRAIVSKTVGNGLMAPPMIALNFGVITALEGRDQTVWQNRMEQRMLPLMTAGFCYWPLVNALNFRYVSMVNRPIVGSLAGVAWSVFSSSQINAPNLRAPLGPCIPGLGTGTGTGGGEDGPLHRKVTPPRSASVSRCEEAEEKRQTAARSVVLAASASSS